MKSQFHPSFVLESLFFVGGWSPTLVLELLVASQGERIFINVSWGNYSCSVFKEITISEGVGLGAA